MIEKDLKKFLDSHPQVKPELLLNTHEFLDNFDLAFFVIDSQGQILFANKQTDTFFPTENTTINLFERLVSPTRLDLFESIDFNVHFFEIIWKRNNIRKYGELNIKKINESEKPLYACSLRDITHRKNNEVQKNLLHKEVIEELSQLNKQIYQSSDIITHGKVNYALNHLIVNKVKDINISQKNLVNKIVSLKLEDDEVIHDLMNIRSNCSEMIVGIEKFQAKSVTESQVKMVDLKNVIKTVYSYYESYLADKRINFTLETECKFSVKALQSSIENIFIHLFDNAIDALDKSPPGEIKSLKVKIFEDSNHYQITVEDNGEPIDAREAYRIFDPYFSTKDKDRHLGLGLSLSRNYMQDLEGDINHHSEKESKYFQLSFPKLKKLEI